MHGTARDLDSSVLSAPTPVFPLTLVEAPSLARRVLTIALIGPVLAALMAPFWLIAGLLVSDPAVREVVAREPLTALKVALGLLVVLAILGWPLAALVRATFCHRRMTVGEGRVSAEELGLFGPRCWSEPLEAYAGLAHRVRSSLSGVRHELILVHPRAARSVLLAASPRTFSRETVAAAAGLFSVAEIPSREAARLTPLHGFFHLAEPRPALAAARIPGLAGL